MTKTTKTINPELSVSAVLPYYHFTAELIEAMRHVHKIGLVPVHNFKLGQTRFD